MLSLLFESAVRATLLMAAVGGVLWALRIRAAAVRHAAWASVMVGMLLLPGLVTWGPRVSLALLPEQAPSFGAAPIVLETGGGASAPTQSAAPAVAVSGTGWRWQDYVLGVYLLGLGLFVMRLTVGTVHVRRLVRSAEVEQGRLVHRACSTPITVGCFRPVVLLPRGWTQWPQAQLDAVLVHEAEHARRRDPLFQWLGLLNRAVFWFHPLAWWLERRISGLAEEVCDAAVLTQGHDPADYSRYLLAMARSAQESGARVQAMGMAMPGLGLRKRIDNILSGISASNVSRTRLFGLAVLIFAAGTVLIAGNPANAQSALAFDVATIKLAADQRAGEMLIRSTEGLTATGATLEALIQAAYQVRFFQVDGLREWMRSERYDVQAKAGARIGGDQHWRMLQSLLADRFRLTLHRETREQAGFALVVANPRRGVGPELRAADDANCPDAPTPANYCGVTGGRGQMTGRKVSMARIAREVSALAGGPVQDQTGLGGFFDFDLQWASQFTEDKKTVAADAAGPSVFTAIQEQLGLKLESRKIPVEFLIVERAERPGEN